MSEVPYFLIVCSYKGKHYEFRAEFIDKFGNLRITGLPNEYKNGTVCQNDHCTDDVFVDNRQINLITDSAYLSFRVIGFDFRGIGYESRGCEFQ